MVNALSNTEAEYRGASIAIYEVVWLKRLLLDLGIKAPSKTTIYCDDMSINKLAKNLVFHALTKHIEIHYHFIGELLPYEMYEGSSVMSEGRML